MATAAPHVTGASPIYFCDSPGQLLILDRRDIPAAARAAIRELHRLRYRYNLKILFFFVLWAASGAVVVATPALLLRVPAYFLMACAMTGLPILMHESNHGLLFRSRGLNRWLGFICGVPALVAVSAYRTVHLKHHADTGTEEDPDSIVHQSPKSLPLVLFYFLFLFVGAYLYIGHVGYTGVRMAGGRTRRNIVVEYAIIGAVFAALLAYLPSWYLLHLWLIPLLIGAQLTNVRGLAEHGLTTSSNPFTETRCVTSNRFVSMMMCNLNYHLDHHLFPGVPWYNLPKLHALLQAEYSASGASVYRSYTAFMLDFLRAARAGIVPDVRLIPVHLREDICA